MTSVNRCRVLLQLAEDKRLDGRDPTDLIEEFGAQSVSTRSLFMLLDDRLKRKLDYFRNLYRRMLDKREKPYSKSNIFFE